MTNLEIKHTIERVLNPNTDSIELGSASKGGIIKVYGDANDPEAFIKKIDTMLGILRYGNDATEALKASDIKLVETISPKGDEPHV